MPHHTAARSTGPLVLQDVLPTAARRLAVLAAFVLLIQAAGCASGPTGADDEPDRIAVTVSPPVDDSGPRTTLRSTRSSGASAAPAPEPTERAAPAPEPPAPARYVVRSVDVTIEGPPVTTVESILALPVSVDGRTVAVGEIPTLPRAGEDGLSSTEIRSICQQIVDAGAGRMAEELIGVGVGADPEALVGEDRLALTVRISTIESVTVEVDGLETAPAVDPASLHWIVETAPMGPGDAIRRSELVNHTRAINRRLAGEGLRASPGVRVDERRGRGSIVFVVEPVASPGG